MTTTRAEAGLKQASAYVARFHAVEAGLPGHDNRALAASRRRAIERFAAAGFPTPKAEAFKYTNLAPLLRTTFEPATAAREDAPRTGLARCLSLAGAGLALVFVDGRFNASLSRLEALPAGLVVSTFAATATGEPEALLARLEAGWGGDAGPLTDLNAAFAQDGAVIRIDAGATLDEPIHVLLVATRYEAPTLVPLRNLISLGEGSRATIVEGYFGGPDQRYWTSVVSEITLARGARLDHVKLQDEGHDAYHLAEATVRLEDEARYAGFALSIGARMARNGIAAEIAGSAAECHLNGVYLGRGRQHLDTTTRVDHIAPGSLSRQVYKGVLDDAAHGVFQGKVTVRPGAQKTDAHQLNKNLMLSESAQVDTKPELEIFADDVKCSHGATAGELDEEALFYLRARGIDVAAARRLLIDGFVAEVLEAVESEPLRRRLAGFVAGWLGQGEG